ncbi:MAG: MobF family relaxase, partial [Acidimicrobiales bacterium]
MMGVDSVEYHRATVLGGVDDHLGEARRYYGSRGETPLMWGGSVAHRLGLEGPVDDDGYDAIYGPGGAADPHLGERMVRTRRPGLELVVSAHKSVAVLGVMGAVDDMHAIVDAETYATMGFLDEWFRRQGGRRGRAQTRTATTGLLWARTRHLTTRAGDPEPHDHVLIANLTEMLDARGGWKALDTGGLRDLVHAATMVGRHAAAERAVALGYAIEDDPGPSGKLGHWRLVGIPDEVVDQFSKRSGEIGAAM